MVCKSFLGRDVHNHAVFSDNLKQKQRRTFTVEADPKMYNTIANTAKSYSYIKLNAIKVTTTKIKLNAE